MMRDVSLFVPDTISDALRNDLATGLRAIADALDARKLAGKFISASAAAGGRHDDRRTFASCSTLPHPSSKRSLSMVLH
jgi:hypothetical protein